MTATRILLATLLTSICQSAYSATSQSHRGELELQYLNSDVDGKAGQLGFTWYFEPVSTYYKKLFKKTLNRPYAEAAFLGRASNVSVDYKLQRFDDLSEIDITEYGFDPSELTEPEDDHLDLSDSKISIEYYVPDSIFYVGVHYHRLTLETTEYNSTDLTENTWGLTGGILLAENLLITTSYREDRDYEPNLRAKYVAELGNGSGVNFLASYTRLDKDSESDELIEGDVVKNTNDSIVALSADYYFSQEFSIGTGLIYAEKTGYEFRTQYFFTEKLALKGRFQTIDENNDISIGLIARL